MNSHSIPRVSIGLPVWNGERYVGQAIESVLAQTYEDFELIISDNGSTDRTPQICQSYSDPRIRFAASNVNRGAAWNFVNVFHLARGEYFKWVAADDGIEPRYLEKCVEVLDRKPSLVLVTTYFHNYNELEGIVLDLEFALSLPEVEPHRRFSRLLRMGTVLPVFGLMRRDILQKTSLIRPFVGSDDCLVAELATLGRFGQIPEPLTWLRRHRDAFHVQKFASDWVEGRAQAVWFDPAWRGRMVLPHCRRLYEYYRIALRSPGTVCEKLRMLAFLSGPLAVRWIKPMTKEFIYGVKLPWLYHACRAVKRQVLKIRWGSQVLRGPCTDPNPVRWGEGRSPR